MKIVIQCAASKTPDAGFFCAGNGKRIHFVAPPEKAPPLDSRGIYARPDNPSDIQGKTWRDKLSAYNRAPAENPFGLVPAYRLYQNAVYRDLVDRFGQGNVFILSAGWGLIRSDFLTPKYDITFSASADAYKRRRPRDIYHDFCQLPLDRGNEIVFFGGKDYRPLFYRLTRNIRAHKIVFYNSAFIREEPGFEFRRYETMTRTNWHYQCATDFLAGRLVVVQH
ncbi:MAG: hypothetical protein OEM59_02195 [Rhodospirillales bacterium]|nr:hypothetical protein [Rhodospirillales bacterium]